MVSLYLAKSSPTEKAWERPVPANLWPKVRRVHVRRKDVPSQAHLVINAGSGDPPARQYQLARNLGALMVCLPQAADWLRIKIEAAIDAGTDLRMVDATLAGRVDV